MSILPLFTKIVGKGFPVVFLHGFLESSSMWNNLPIDELNVQCVLIDLPGHGNSTNIPLGEPSILKMAELVLETIRFHGIDEFSVVGHSMGGYVALELNKISKSVRKIVLLNSNCWDDPSAKKIDRMRVAEIVFKSKRLFLNEAIPNLFLNPEEHQSEISQLIDEADNMFPEAIAYSSKAMANRANLCNFLLDHIEKTYVIQGEGDRIVSLNQMLDTLKDHRENLFVLRNTGHMAHIENPKDVMAVLNKMSTESKNGNF